MSFIYDIGRCSREKRLALNEALINITRNHPACEHCVHRQEDGICLYALDCIIAQMPNFKERED